jgi:hypothetical protein
MAIRTLDASVINPPPPPGNQLVFLNVSSQIYIKLDGENYPAWLIQFRARLRQSLSWWWHMFGNYSHRSHNFEHNINQFTSIKCYVYKIWNQICFMFPNYAKLIIILLNFFPLVLLWRTWTRVKLCCKDQLSKIFISCIVKSLHILTLQHSIPVSTPPQHDIIN